MACETWILSDPTQLRPEPAWTAKNAHLVEKLVKNQPKSQKPDYGSHIFCIFIFCEKRRKKGHFLQKRKKKRKKIIPMKIGQNCIQLNKCYKCFNHLTGKNFYTRIFFIFLSLFMLETMWSFRNLSKMSNIEPKIGKKWRKFIFHFSSSHFSRKTKNWKNAKTKNFLFRWDP